MTIKIRISNNLSKLGEHHLSLGVFNKPTKNKTKNKQIIWPKEIKQLEKMLGSNLVDIATTQKFIGEKSCDLFTFCSSKACQSMSLFGLGQENKANKDSFRQLAAKALHCGNKHKAKKITICLPSSSDFDQNDMVASCSEGIYLADYAFDKYLSEKKQHYVKEVVLYLADKINEKALAKTIIKSKDICHGVNLTRSLVNEPPLHLNPQQFVKEAKAMAKENGLSISVFDENHLKKENMNMMLAVAKASLKEIPPRLIKLSYKPKITSKEHVVLVGKGLTYDTGGLSLKPADAMKNMKHDMSGAASVFGAMAAIGKLKPKVRVTGYLACVENSIGPNSYHPDDILLSRKGVSVEVVNTDAEGRLVLGDALDYAIDKEKPDTIIDLATLTGACMVGLGPSTAGLYSNKDKLAKELLGSAKETHEDMWHMPLNHDLLDQLKSSIADITNCGTRYGGSITAALFLQKFVNEDVAWAHLDIAGPAFTDKGNCYTAKGGTGFAVRTLIDYICKY